MALLHVCGVRVCLVHRWTGYPCLTCGASRAAALLLSGHPWLALCQQPLAVVLGALLAVWFGLHSLCLLAWRQKMKLVCSRRERLVAVGVLCVSALLNWCYLLWRGV